MLFRSISTPISLVTKQDEANAHLPATLSTWWKCWGPSPPPVLVSATRFPTVHRIFVGIPGLYYSSTGPTKRRTRTSRAVQRPTPQFTIGSIYSFCLELIYLVLLLFLVNPYLMPKVLPKIENFFWGQVTSSTQNGQNRGWEEIGCRVREMF